VPWHRRGGQGPCAGTNGLRGAVLPSGPRAEAERHGVCRLQAAEGRGPRQDPGEAEGREPVLWLRHKRPFAQHHLDQHAKARQVQSE